MVWLSLSCSRHQLGLQSSESLTVAENSLPRWLTHLAEQLVPAVDERPQFFVTRPAHDCSNVFRTGQLVSTRVRIQERKAEFAMSFITYCCLHSIVLATQVNVQGDHTEDVGVLHHRSGHFNGSDDSPEWARDSGLTQSFLVTWMSIHRFCFSLSLSGFFPFVLLYVVRAWPPFPSHDKLSGSFPCLSCSSQRRSVITASCVVHMGEVGS